MVTVTFDKETAIEFMRACSSAMLHREKQIHTDASAEFDSVKLDLLAWTIQQALIASERTAANK